MCERLAVVAVTDSAHHRVRRYVLHEPTDGSATAPDLDVSTCHGSLRRGSWQKAALGLNLNNGRLHERGQTREAMMAHFEVRQRRSEARVPARMDAPEEATER